MPDAHIQAEIAVLQAKADASEAEFEPVVNEISNRENVRPYELAMMIRRGLVNDFYRTKKEMAENLGVSLKTCGQAYQLLLLPRAVVNAFPSPLDLEYRWGTPLKNAVNRDRDAVIEEARKIQSESLKPTAKEVLARLIAAAAEPALSGNVTPEPVGPKVPASDVAIDLIEGMPSNTSDEEARQAKKDRKAAEKAAARRAHRAANPELVRAKERATYAANSEKILAQQKALHDKNPEKFLAQRRAYEGARRQAKKLEKLAALQAQTTAATAAVEPAEVENVAPPTKKPFDSWAFVASMYKTPKDLQETLDKMTPRQIARAQRRFRPS